MTINVYRLRGVEKELRRLNENFELYLSHVCGVTPSSVKRKNVEGETGVSYTDEEQDAVREIEEILMKDRNVFRPSN